MVGPADQVITDTSGPRIIESTLDLNSGLLSFTFDEYATRATVNTSTISVTNVDTGVVLIQLDDQTVLNSTMDGRNINVIIPQEDLNIINSAGSENIGLSISAGLIEDILTNSFDSAVVIPTLIEDQTPPSLTQWSIDMNSGFLQLTFSEAIRTDNFTANLLTLQNAPTATRFFQLTSGNFSSINNVFSIQLSQADLNSVKELGSVGLSESTSYLTLVAGAIADLRGNIISGIPDGEAVGVQTIIRDVVPPELNSFGFEFTNNGSAPVALTLYFSEPVNASSIDLSGLVLMNSSDGSGSSYTLTTSTVPAIFSSRIPIVLSNNDLAGITTVPGLGVSESETFLTASSSAVRDVSGVFIVATPTAISVTPPLIDLDPPRLLSFTFSLGNGNLTFVFSQDVTASTFDGTQLTIQNAQSSPSGFYTFVGGSA